MLTPLLYMNSRLSLDMKKLYLRAGASSTDARSTVDGWLFFILGQGKKSIAAIEKRISNARLAG